MKKYKLLIKYLCMLLFVLYINNANAQTGLNFQGVARTSNNVIIASQDISLKLSILQGSATGIPEYIEVRKVKTNAQGLFTAVIGDSETTITLGNFADIDWKLSPKFLKIEIDPFAGNNFISMGTTQFQYVAYAKFANSVNAENISGVVPVARGGTGASSLSILKSNLSLDKVNNTADTLKPISKLIQSALDLKLNIVDSTKAYVTPTQLASYNFSSGVATIDTTGLSNRINFKLNISDTALLLRKADTSTLSNRINLKLNITDTSTLSNRINLKLNTYDTSTLSNRINLKLNTTDTSSLLRKSQVGANNGAASLDATGKVPSVQIPAISFSSVDVVNSMEKMLSFTTGTNKATDRLVGSIVVRLDSSKNFVLSNLPASNRANWIELVNPDAPVQTVNGLTGSVDLRKANISDLIYIDNTSDKDKPVSDATKDSLRTKLYITDTSLLLKKSDTAFLLQKVDTAAILAMYAKKFTKDVVVNFGGGSLGKYANGTTIPAKGKTLDEFLTDLVSNSIPPTFYLPSVSIGANPGFGNYEIGYVPGLVTLNNTYTANNGGAVISALYYKDASSTPLTGGNSITLDTLKTTVSFKVVVNYAKGTGTKPDNLGTQFPNTINAGSISATNNFTPYSKRYWGGITSPFLENQTYKIEDFNPSSDQNGSNKGFSFNFTPNGRQYIFVAYLASNAADITKVTWGSLDYTFTKSLVWFENARGYKQLYKVFTSTETYDAGITGISTQ
jgi:hypothetical protein